MPLQVARVRRPPPVAPVVDDRRELDDARNRLIAGDATVDNKRARAQLANPFAFFDAIFCRSMDDERERWARIQRAFEVLDIAWRVERFPGVRAMTGKHQRGCALSARQIVAEAHHRGLSNFLLLEDDALFLDTTLDVVGEALDDLRGRDWDLLYLGGAVHGRRFPFADRTNVLQVASGVTSTHALVVNHTAFERILDELSPTEDESFDQWMATFLAFDQYLPRRVADGVFTAFIHVASGRHPTREPRNYD